MPNLIFGTHRMNCLSVEKKSHGSRFAPGMLARDVVIGRNVVIGHAAFWHYHTDAEFAFIAIGWVTLVDDISSEARAIVDAENAADGAATAPSVPPTTAPIGPASCSPCAAPSCAPRTVPCACAAIGRASVANSIVANNIFDFIGPRLGNSNRLGLGAHQLTAMDIGSLPISMWGSSTARTR